MMIFSIFQVIFPLIFTDMLGKVDVEATVTGGGPAGQAGAIRYGISLGLRSFLSPEIVEEMRLGNQINLSYLRRSSCLRTVNLYCSNVNSGAVF